QHMSGEQLRALVPHRGKMFLLSRITAHSISENSITAEYDVSTFCILYDEELGGIPCWATFEIMAQGISALSTIHHISYGLSDTAAPGVILSVSNFTARQEQIAAGSTVEVQVRENFRDGSVCRYDCELYEKGKPEPVATTAITVMGIPDIDSFFMIRGGN
ncbi:MAG: 3-hydroxylacyl-ACP dehydratase, partial [Treponema sp.]|nr:3-hydroxylacyl-ACP dehydratase [Treponema sp.]